MEEKRAFCFKNSITDFSLYNSKYSEFSIDLNEEIHIEGYELANIGIVITMFIANYIFNVIK